jgi:lipopolysaccharide heptosyltransferase II
LALDDLNALARRNRTLIEARHQPSRRQQIRDGLLRVVAHLPVPQVRGDGRTILLVRPDHVGDVLLTGPAIQALKAARPGARLVALVGPWSAGVISAYPEIDLTLTLPFPGFARHPVRTAAQPYWLAWQRAQQLRRLQAETAILFRPDHWWGALLIWLAGIPQRIGYDLPNVAPFLTEAIPFRRQHVVLQDLALLRAWVDPAPEAVRLSYPVDSDERTAITARLAELGLPPGAPRLIIHPGSGTAIKQWAPERWAAVADRLAAARGAPVIFTGGDHELRLIETISGQMAAPAINLAGETNLSQLAALYEHAALVLGPDSGPLHLAAAVGAPTITLFGPADPAEFGPWGDPDKHAILTSPIACRPCRILEWPDDDPRYHPCVRDISVEAVIAAAQRVTQANSPTGATP